MSRPRQVAARITPSRGRGEGEGGARPVRTLAARLAARPGSVAILFGGQGAPWIDELEELRRTSEGARALVEVAADVLQEVASDPTHRSRGHWSEGADLRLWLDTPEARPRDAYLASAVVSMPMILTTQLARYAALLEDGLDVLVARGGVASVSGHSQGLAAALCVAECPDRIDPSVARGWMWLMALQGIAMADSYRGPRRAGEASPMAAIAGPSVSEVQEMIAETFGVQDTAGAQAPVVSLQNTRTRSVVSGTPGQLLELRRAFVGRADREAAARKRGGHGGEVFGFTWEWLDVGTPFHSPHMGPGLEWLREQLDSTAPAVCRTELRVDVCSPVDGQSMAEAPDRLDAFLRSQFVEPVRWTALCATLAQDDALEQVLDLGPGDGVAKLEASNLRGSGKGVLPLVRADARRALFTEGAPAPPATPCWRDFAPQLVSLSDGRRLAETRFTRATGAPPVFLPGMTPTTVDAAIVAAAANAGFIAELAGGGQPTEDVFWKRLDELCELLEPGREVVFNALFLDRWLWDLHLGRARLVQRARRQGYPICGVTVSAGLPEPDAAVALLDELAGDGLWLNAFKPGTVQQVDQVIRIARAAREHTIFVHLEGGHAGGHHSWEDLEGLLLRCWHRLRGEPNVVLCAGGGVGHPEGAAALLTGRWSEPHGTHPMPVDAVFVGTAAMACLESTATASVKRALAGAAGVQHEGGWVLRDEVRGDVTSGRSGLDADIHYLDNAASRCGRLLDSVAGDETRVADRRDEIIEALGQTAKPYFGDLDSMSWLEVIERAIDLMAVGRRGRYDDGPWPDPSYRARVFDLMQRAEARLCARDRGLLRPVIDAPSALDEPKQALARLAAAYPHAADRRLHPADRLWFVGGLCRRAGKPVCFVPVIDADVRRWYKADALWQAHDDRYDADQVLVIPGPRALAGIERPDEPASELLARFCAAPVAALEARGVRAVPRARLRRHQSPVHVPTGVLREEREGEIVLRAVHPGAPETWLEQVAVLEGPVAEAVALRHVHRDGRSVPNPLRSLLAAAPGATLRLRVDADGACTSLRMLLGGEEATVTSDAHRVVAVAAGDGFEPLTVVLGRISRPDGAAFVIDAAAQDARDAEAWQRAVFGRALRPVALFEEATEDTAVDHEQARAWARVTGADGSGDPASGDLAFALAFAPIFRVLSAGELASGALRLVHLEHRCRVFEGGPLRPGEGLRITARVERIEDRSEGREVLVRAHVSDGDTPRLELEERFFIRGDYGESPFALRADEILRAALEVTDAAAAEALGALCWLRPRPDRTFDIGARLRLDARVRTDRPRGEPARYRATGTLLGADGDTIADLNLDRSVEGPSPLHTLVELLSEAEASPRPAQARTLAERTVDAPSSMEAFAAVGGDRNPIHLRTLAARLAGLPGPIVHGMWTAARAHALLVDDVAGGAERRLRERSMRFLLPVEPGESLRMRVRRRGLCRGRVDVEIGADVRRDGHWVTALAGQAEVAPPPTAWLFPGQGIQRQGMGLSALGRSPAARRIWERADAHTRSALGFSVLQVVRDNPRELDVRGDRWVHPRGVLNLTQLTQVAMAVLAQAQVAELREAGVLGDQGITCGHSVGEYNAISAITGILPLERVVEIVYRRGLVMHRHVPRDEQGESPFAMGVIRPHHAAMTEGDALALVADRARATGAFLEIVNFNVRHRQYSVVGERAALAGLGAAVLERGRAAGGRKKAWLEVPGVDVPFHSSALRAGVEQFRSELEECLPARVPADRLVGRYVPNLVARPFALTADFAAEIVRVTDGAEARAIQAELEGGAFDADRVARSLLVELLAWQFASPVRWIETMDCLFASPDRGGLGVERVVELGVGAQPTVSNMMRATLSDLGRTDDVEVLHIEAHADLLFARDADPAPIAEEPVDQADVPERKPVPEVAAPAAPQALPAAAVQDRPASVDERLRALLALQARVRPEQIHHDECIDDLFGGVSSRRNQALVDVGAEFGVPAIDGAHERPLADVIAEIARRGAGSGCGSYLMASVDDAMRDLPGASGRGAREVGGRLVARYGVGDGLAELALLLLALAAREGASGRGGDLGDPRVTTASGEALVDVAAELLSAHLGQPIQPIGGEGAAPGGGVVDASAVEAIEARLFGPDGALRRAAEALAGGAMAPRPEPAPPARAPADDVLVAELGSDAARWLAPRFEPDRHVALASCWAWAKRDVAKLAFDALNGHLHDEDVEREGARLTAFGGADPAVAAAARWYARRAPEGSKLHAVLTRVALGGAPAPLPVADIVPTVHVGEDGTLEMRDVAPRSLDWATERLDLDEVPRCEDPAARARLADLVGHARQHAFDFRRRTALVTGCGPGSIAAATVGWLLRGGARVVATTSSYGPERLAYFRALYARAAGPGAELHVVPFNQASLRDADALVDWLLDERCEQAGASVRVLKERWRPDLLLPFAAISDLATADDLGARSEAALRAMLLGTGRLVSRLGARLLADSGATRCHVVLPLSPNHGLMGGDGLYAESKAALETLLARWASERDAWGGGTSICGARIGWVRGTGLMDANDPIAAVLERDAGLRTFSGDEMGLLIAALCTDDARQLAASEPLRVDLCGGFERIDDLRGRMGRAREDLDEMARHARRRRELARIDEAGAAQAGGEIEALPDWPRATSIAPVIEWAAQGRIPLERMVVIVGAGEVGPCGPSRTRFELEVDGTLSAAGVLELAWLCGLVRYERSGTGRWIDSESGEEVAEGAICDRYREAVIGRCGIRPIEPATTGFDPERLTVMAEVHLERDLRLTVRSEAEARDLERAAPESTLVQHDPESGGWIVTRRAGSRIRVPREARLDRQVAGVVPEGFDFARFGLGPDMVERVDKVALFNLVATVDAFVSAGLSPEELLAHVHPARVGNTQGGGLGGAGSIRRLYLDHILGQARQNDALQEMLINVAGAYVVQSYVGSYGAMVHPVAACATAAVSLEEAYDKLLAGRADFVVAGAFDDINAEGMIGFADMAATASSDRMAEMGIEPAAMSRSNDRRRRGFVEAQGGGTLLLCRGDLARDLGLDVLGVLGWVGSFSDGVQRSIPAPGLGVLASAAGGADSPLGQALASFGLEHDDIAVVSKHDTSTAANDPNEARLHHRIARALGRDEGNPLFVISQKTLTGHSKGGAAAWQAIGLCQALGAGVIPPNRNLESVDDDLREAAHLAYTDTTLRPGPAVPMRAGLLTSLGFGHVGAIALIVHPQAFRAALDGAAQGAWSAKVAQRREQARRELAESIMGLRPRIELRTGRRFGYADHTDQQADEECAMLLDPSARLDPRTGTYRTWP